MEAKIYYLTGFMGSGKSTIGPILANTLGWDFFDLDKVIEAQEGAKVTEIFKRKGEAYFRKAERETLKRISAKNNVIISLGGGTIAADDNFNFIRSRGKIIYLKSSTDMAYKRLKFKRDRPSLLFEGEELPTREEFVERINKLLVERTEYYEKADFIVDTDTESVGRTVDKIAKFIKNNSKDSTDNNEKKYR